MIDLNSLQQLIKAWSSESFGEDPPWIKLLGVAEEVGELCHHILKRYQRIRVDEKHDEEIKDAVGDIMIYLMDFCASESIDLEKCIKETWARVKLRTREDQLRRKEF